ncbi:MAG: hypothetical protein M1819_000666 [Sarea resinae]|nr:MAG: hypothetical protein M1819_000666 [Sarea resinae]
MPQQSTQVAQIFFDSSSANRRHQAAPLTAWLRVPLDWYHSSTYSYFPDETHTSIRRAYTPPSSPSTKRQFCGYCGTPLSFWTESSREEADYISLTLGSLIGEDLRELEDMGLLPFESETESTSSSIEGKREAELGSGSASPRDDTTEALPWFETLIEGSRLGRLEKRRVRKVGLPGGRLSVEWEIIEWDDGINEGGVDSGTTKRKIGDVEGDDADKGDVVMSGGL